MRPQSVFLSPPENGHLHHALLVLQLEEDLDNLTFRVASGDGVLRLVMSLAEWKIYESIRSQKRLTFTDAVRLSSSTNRKAVSSALKKAVNHGAMRREGAFYMPQG